MRVRVSRRAEMDLAEITDFIALENPERADQFEDELLEHARKIAFAPLAYAERTDLGPTTAILCAWGLCNFLYGG
jgi:toxin ParE1/3/4